MFPSYEGYQPLLPVKKVSRDGVPAIHRFYDTSPLSPSGRFLAFTEFDHDDQLPNPGDEASVVVVDVLSGEEVYRTRTIAWDTQLGAQVQWGSNDCQLFFNSMSPADWQPRGVVVDLETAQERELGGPVYMVSPDGKTIISPNLVRIWLVQPGYGVVVPPEFRVEPRGAQEDDGLFVTDVATGASRLALSFKQIYETLPSAFSKLDMGRGGFYGFHAKWSPDGSRILFILRWRDRTARKGQSLNWLLSMRSDMSEIQVALTPDRWAGGHHPNWCPDSEHIVMNLAFPNWNMRFPRAWRLFDRLARRFRIPLYRSAYSLRLARFKCDGTALQAVASSQIGSGHPTWHQEMDAVLTDAYPWEPVAAGDGTSPIRLISAQSGRSETVVRIRTVPDFLGPRREWRVDPHPAWNYQSDKFVFNGAPEGVRGVFIADVSSFLRHGKFL